MAKNFLKKQIISTNTAISSKNATAPMVLEMMTVSLSGSAVGIRGGMVDELMVGVIVIGGVVDELMVVLVAIGGVVDELALIGGRDRISEKCITIISNHQWSTIQKKAYLGSLFHSLHTQQHIYNHMDQMFCLCLYK